MTVTNTDPIPPDTRSIDDMAFGSGAADQPAVAKTVRDTLRRCGVTVAHEIEELGCTGASAKGLTTTEIAALRVGLGGGGVGLPCFVPPARYCLAHSTIGGLQVGQMSRFSEQVEKISRELSPRERGQVELTESARRVRGNNLNEQLMKTADALSGRDLPPGVEIGGTGDIVEDDDDDQPHAKQRVSTADDNGEDAFICPEHDEPLWQCRYCVAEMIVDGDLEPQFSVVWWDDQGHVFREEGGPNKVVEAIEKNGMKAEIYILAATFSRKLARD